MIDKSFKWKTITALVIIYLAVIMGWNWVWGILFIMWLIPALRTGQTHLVEPISCKQNPILFWLIVGTWIMLSLFMIVFDLLRFLSSL